MNTEDTIAAISTPLGRSGIGIVRLSGRDAIKIVDKIFLSPKKKRLEQIPSHRILYGHIVEPINKEIIDEVLVSVMKAPYTYTKEDVVEINCHGGPVPLRRILEIVLKAGARLAEPGEFTQRAFLNGRIDLAQAEAVLDVINALTEESQKAAIEQLKGGLSEKIETIREKLIELTAFIEAFIDFPEEEIEPPSKENLNKKASEIQHELKQLIEGSRYGMILREGLKTAIIGRPNVGKSSLLNALLEQDRVIVTEMPGTTRDIIEEYLNIHGFPIKIMDTAGIRKVRDIAEREGVARSLRAMKEADLVLLILDGSENLHETDKELIEKSNSVNTILVINKIDLPPKISPDALPSDKPIIRISALRGTGLSELKEEIIKTSLKGCGDFYPKGDKTGITLVTNIRHLKALEKAYASISSFIDGLNKSLSPEFLSIELRDALDALGEILGITTPEEILNKIFSNFCIGK
jgi:tRNA modification GTPase